MPESRETGETFKHGLIAAGEILLINGMFTFVNWISGWDWAVPSVESIRFNLTNPWQWEEGEEESFLVNQLGHPLQGSLAFNAGRVNGFSFYQNIIFNLFGSATWEIFFENNHASINDFFTTVSGSFTVGEISYRLYMEAYAAGIPAPLAFIISPAAGLHRLLTGWEPPPANRNLYELRYFLGGGYAQTHSSINSGQQELFAYNGPHARAGLKTVYGNPFEQDTNVPYRHFELAMFYGMNPGYYHDIHVVTDGYLFSFSPVYSNRHTMSTGLSLHMDFNAQGRFHLYDSTINQYSNALNWTIKYQQLFSENTTMQIKSHAGFTFIGASNYYSQEIERELINYGYGLNSKLFFNLENSMLGRLEVDLFGYILWSYPGTSALSDGTVYWLFSDITYSRFVSEYISAGISYSLSREWGYFGEFTDTVKKNNSVMVFVAWNL